MGERVVSGQTTRPSLRVSGVFYITQGIATAEEQEAVVVLAAGGLSAVSALVALYSVYVVLRPFISAGSSDDAEVE
ncbi:hypothetical protein SAMN04487950_2625 [Halogranum rubrum]|uniref:Uncharacterized protein n=1 Tax=Halogranum rubrum TaxID=553466 RepID=A0A1I4F4L8_9EURY|nr:hypothetical protein [Halogranum rubrum]SFL12874.1 hypothetical protein SAMN04487950_2625 [Halogranum rubrum]